MIKKVSAPVRLDFAGGTTDIFPFTRDYGGAVLNAGINHYVVGKLITTAKRTYLEYEGNIPTSSGLGTSGVMNLVWLALISKTKDKYELAEKVYAMEQAMGLVGGKQDQYAAAFGGINLFEFKGNKVKINPVRLSKEKVKELENSLLIVYTGEHFSRTANKLMIDNLIKGKNNDNLVAIKNVALRMKKAFEKMNFEKIQELMDQETLEREKLHKHIITPKMKKMMQIGMNNGGMAAKVCGSGNGGSILFLCDNKKKLAKRFGRNVIDFKFDFNGLVYL